MLRNEGDRLTRVVVCPPAGEYRGVTEPDEHGMNEPADPDRIGRQYAARRVLGCRGMFPAGFFAGFKPVEIDWYGPSCANVICLRDGEVVANRVEAGPTMRALEEAGVTVHGLDLSEYRKGGGGPTCIILPVDRE